MRKIGLPEIFLSSGTIELKILKFCDHVLGSLVASLIPSQVPTKAESAISRILVIRPGGIGDAVFLLPIFKAIRSKYPQICIDVLCQRRNAAVFLSQGHLVDHVFVYNSFRDIRNLHKNIYSAVVDTEQWHYLTAITALNIKTKLRIGFGTRLLRRKFFNVNVDYDSNAFELENFSRLFESMMAPQEKIINIDDCFSMPQNLKSWSDLQIPSNSVTISIGASVPERRLSTAQMIALAKSVIRRGFHPVFLGGKDVVLQSRQLMAQLDSGQVYNFVGKISLQESAALIKKSRVFIGTDSGLMHLACAVGGRVIALFGAGNMKKWMNQTDGKISINDNVPCSPCTFFGYGLPVCRGSFHCLRKMDLESVLDRHLPLGVKNG